MFLGIPPPCDFKSHCSSLLPTPDPPAVRKHTERQADRDGETLKTNTSTTTILRTPSCSEWDAGFLSLLRGVGIAHPWPSWPGEG